MSEDSAPDPDSDRHFQLLLADYQSGREDDRTLLTVQSAGVGLVITLIGLLGAMLMQTCNFQPDLDPSECQQLPPLVLAGAPLIPTATAAFLLMLGALATVRNYYLRAVERQLREYVHRPFEEMPGTAPGPGMYMTLTTELTSLRRGRISHRLLARLVVVSASVAFLGITFFIGLNVEQWVQILMAAFYGPLFALVVYEYIAAGLGGRSLFMKAVLAASARAGNRDYLPTVEEFRKRSRQRSILSYLGFPRPEDWSKLFNAPVLYIPVALLVGDFTRWLDFLILLVVLEFLIYQARYQYNDVRDTSLDQRHIESHARGRLPQGSDPATSRQYVHWSLAVALVRLLIAAAVGFFLLPEAFWLLGTVALISVCYEWLRSKAPTELITSPTPRVVMIWLAAGLGYAVRGGLAVTMAGAPLTTAVGGTAVAFYYFLGVMFVLVPWVLDAASYCRIDLMRRWYHTEELVAKPHLSVLLSYVHPIDRPYEAGKTRAERHGSRVDALADGYRFWTPWNASFIVAAGLGGALGAMLSRGGEVALPFVALLTTVSAGSAVLVASGKTKRSRWARYGLGSSVMVAASYAWSSLVDAPPVDWAGILPNLLPLAVLLPWAMFWVFYVAIHDQSYHDLKYSLQKMFAALVGLSAKALRFLVGKATWKALGYEDALKSWRARLLRDSR
ncbi:hypothetical protein L0U85_09465 [Glycomyces sp. L485]|uniref:hypothetical protein n=1 Tax=Glycomyces sp. L485 TaxID=2909235 RepID=UPI001F4B37E9|nr:hypothetical protein [Glycomyces sp. L485]MCH7231078.1 hypothetical protein [Glycomyces sp. L485]